MVHQSKKFIEVLKSQYDFDEINMNNEAFGFFSFKGAKINQQKKDEEQQSLILNDENKYEKIELANCKVNIYALKKFIRTNLKSLRIINISFCKFYLSDKDAQLDKKQVSNLRMLQVLNFIWLIESFKFQDLEILTIKLANDPKVKLPQKAISAKVSALEDYQVKSIKQNNYELTKKEAQEIFGSDDYSQYIKYEFSDKKRFKEKYSEDKMKKFTQDLIWGDLLDQEKFYEKLYENILNDIKENLEIYKKYTKYAFNDGKLIICGDVLTKGLSRNQLYNVIHQHCQNIHGIVFKGNGKISPQIFSDLMTQLFLISQIESISFIESSLDQKSLFELQYLFSMKNVKYFILYKAYFLKSEIEELMEVKNDPLIIDINHFRFTILDIDLKKKFEFIPYSFHTNLISKKPTEMLIQAQKIYLFQSYYPKQIQNQIVFYQGKNVSIYSESKNEEYLFEYWQVQDNIDQVKIDQLKKDQEALVTLIEQLIRSDDINIMNYKLLTTLISFVIEEDSQNRFKSQLQDLKSVQCLMEEVPLSLVEEMIFQEEKHLRMLYSYMKGYTHVQDYNLYYAIQNSELFTDIVENKIKPKEKLLSLRDYLILKDSLDSNIDNSGKFINFEKLLKINFVTLDLSEDAMKQINNFIKKSINLQVLQLCDCHLTNGLLDLIDFSFISQNLEEFDISFNTNLDSLEFLNAIFKKAKKLKKLHLGIMELTQKKTDSADFTLVSPTLEEIILEYNILQDVKFLNQLFQSVPLLKILNFYACNLKEELFKQLKLPKGLKKLNLSYNSEVKLLTALTQIGSIEGMELEELDAIMVNTPSEFPEEYKQYLAPNTLQGLKKLNSVYFQKNKFTDCDYVNVILNNCEGLKNLRLVDEGLDSHYLLKLQLENHYSVFESLDLSYGSSFSDYSFLNLLFEKCPNLKKLNFSESNLTSYKFNGVKLDLLPASLEEFIFNGNEYGDYSQLLNMLFSKCVNLKKLHLERCKISDYYWKLVNFQEISDKLEDFNISTNPTIEEYGFLMDIIRKATNLKKLNISNNNIPEEKLKDVDFKYAYSLENFIVENNGFYNDSYMEEYYNKRNLFIDIKSFEDTSIKVEESEYINYFKTSENQNLSDIKDLSEQKKEEEERTRYKQQEDQINEENDITQNQDQSQIDYSFSSKLKSESGNKAENKNQLINQKSLNSSLYNYSNNINPIFFYTLFNFFEQIIDDDDLETKISEQQSVFSFTNYSKTMETLGMIDSQNVYKHSEYYLIHLFNSQFSSKIKRNFKELFGNDSTITSEKIQYFLTEINLKNKTKYKNLNFLQIFFDKCKNIKKIDLSNMDVEETITLNINPMPQLVDFDFSNNENSSVEFLINVIKNAPSLQKLNLRKTNSFLFEFSEISTELLELDLSDNKDISSFQFLAEAFKRCQKLQKLNLSNTNLSYEKLDYQVISLIPKSLEDLDLSNNENATVHTVINYSIPICQNLKRLNISNCNIDYQANHQISYGSLSPELVELNFSKNHHYYNMGFISTILERCPKLEKFDMSYQTFELTYDCLPVTFSQNNLKEFNFSGNTKYNNYQFITDMILASTQTVKLTIENIDLHTSRVTNFNFDQIGKKIQELNISHHTYMTDLTFLNHMSESPCFEVLIANDTVINNSLINTLNIPEVFKNIKVLELAQSINLTNYEFFNTIFAHATKLEKFNISKMKVQQKQINQINFKKTPSTLSEFIFNGNDLITSFSFLSDLFTATKDSLKILSLVECDLTKKKLEGADFSLLSNKVEKIDISENENLDTLDFIVPFFQKSSSIKLNTFKISKITFEMHLTIQKYTNQIEEIDNPIQIFDLQYFTQPEEYQVSINFRKFLNYLQSDTKEKSLSQQIWSREDGKSKAFANILKYILEFKTIDQPISTLTHFLFLMLNESKIQCDQLQPFSFIFSPYSLFQQNQLSELNYDNKQDQQFVPDAYNIAFFTLNLLSKPTDYIFGYDKFFFEKFQEFYTQSLSKNTSDMEFIIRLSKKMNEFNTKRAFLPIKLNLNYQSLIDLNLNELDVLYLLNSIPPAQINITGMSIQLVKSWYAILYSSPLSVKTQINVNYDLLENTSISNYLILIFSRIYIQNFEGKTLPSKVKKILGNIGYSFFNIFGSPPKQYKFDHTVIHLNNFFQRYIDEGKHNILRLLYPIYLFVCVFAVWFFSLNDSTCGGSLSQYSYIMYAGFGAITFLLEYLIFVVCVKFVTHLVPDIKPNCLVTFPNPLINKIKLFIMDIEWLDQKLLNFTMLFISSQLSRFDFLANIGFILQTYQCEQYGLFIAAIVSLSITTLTNFIFFIQNIFSTSYNKLITGAIDKLYQLCHVLEFQAAAEILDYISPSNSVIIHRRMFNQRVFYSFIRILFQDIPLIIIKALFLYAQSTLNSSMIFSIVSSCLMVLISLNKFLTITPSRLGQEDFIYLSEIKKQKQLPNYLDKLAKYECKITSFNQFEVLKCIKSAKYYHDVLQKNNQGISLTDLKNELKLIKEIRKFQSTTDFIENFFGDSSYNDHLTNKTNINKNINSAEVSNNKEAGSVQKQIELHNEDHLVRIKSASTVKSQHQSQSNLLLIDQDGKDQKQNENNKSYVKDMINNNNPTIQNNSQAQKSGEIEKKQTQTSDLKKSQNTQQDSTNKQKNSSEKGKNLAVKK